MIDTKEVRESARLIHVNMTASVRSGAELVGIIDELCAELDALRKPVDGAERPDDVALIRQRWATQAFFLPPQAKIDIDTLHTYIIALEAENRRLRGGPAKQFGVWRCQECGEMVEQTSAKWRWAGDRWQHHHEYPTGHVDATYFGEAS